MTIYDIAKEAGVAASTVSRVINNKPGIKAETRERIQELLKKYNFTPDVAARGLVMQSSKIIGILMQDIRVVHHIDSAYLIEQDMTKHGYCCITMSTGKTDEKRAEYIKILEERRVEGAILVGSMFAAEKVAKSIQEHLSNIPIVIVNGYLDLPNVYGVMADEMGGVQECTELMISRGKKKLAFVNDADTPSNRKKIEGFKKAMKAAGWTEEDLWIYQTVESSMEGGFEAAKQVLQEHPDVQGLVYSIDLTAVGGIRALKELGVDVPGQISVTGVDNSVYGEISAPQLTTLDNRLVELSGAASEILLAAMSGKMCDHKRIYPAKIIEREST
ncbi:MAG: LacI family DNA-binding transcriptional regulator [Eubacteriales bacterium]|nr:LacI family DNA-binding transcriptional regulator [Eubacteriales bacterium]